MYSTDNAELIKTCWQM